MTFSAQLPPESQPRALVSGRPLKVLLATARFLLDRGGTEIHVHEVAQRLAAFGAEVTVVSTAAHKAFPRESYEGRVRVLRVRAWPPERDYYFAPGLARVICRGEYDIVHCQGYHTFAAPIAMLAALAAHIPYVVTLHSGGHSSRLRRSIRPTQARLLRPLVRRARQVIASSQFEAELFAERTGLPLGSFVVVPSGVDLPATEPQDRHAEPPLILSIGRVESYKGHQRVVEALPELEQRRPGMRLHVVGSGSYEAELHRLAQRLGVAHLLKIAAVPAERRDEMARLLRRARCVTMLSEYESQGLAIQEALALGCPLVVSDSTALGELSRYANVRALAREATSSQIASAIDELLEVPEVDPPPLFTWDQCAATLLDLYLETLQRS